MASDLPNKQSVFAARLPLPPIVNTYAPIRHNRRFARLNIKSTPYYIIAAPALEKASFYHTGLIFSLHDSSFHIPLVANLKFCIPYLPEKVLEGHIDQVISATLRFLGLKRHPVVEIHIQSCIEIDDPHAEIELSCKTFW